VTSERSDHAVTILRPDGSREPATRSVPVEAPVSIEFNGIGYAVMMATPADLDDFVTGFALSERLIRKPDEIVAIDIHESPIGWIVRTTLPEDRMAEVLERVRTRVSESSCGLCGLDNLEQVARPLPRLPASPPIATDALFHALHDLKRYQPLNAATGAVHAAAFCDPDGTIRLAREDVGRHNALDKLIGALARAGIVPAKGFVLTTSRCSYEIVEKAVLAGAATLVTISAPTSLAVDRAEAAGLRLIVLARPDAALVMGG
jgi:FdhD protein